jgi:choline dehydrogenase-like flavoprotein
VTTADGCPDETGMKSDAENRLLLPALSDGVKILTGTEITRLITSPDGRRVVAAEARHEGRTLRINATSFALAGGAVNSAALLLRSADDAHHPQASATRQGCWASTTWSTTAPSSSGSTRCGPIPRSGKKRSA